jgi:hypothetical protein
MSSKRFSASVLFLILANCLPILGILFFHWNLTSILTLYWAESGVIGFYTILKMVFAHDNHLDSFSLINGTFWKLLSIPFFIVHFGVFMVGHGFALMFLVGLFAYTDNLTLAEIIVKALPGILLLTGSHGFSFIYNYLISGERHHQTPSSLMMQPYSRIGVMQLTVILGSILALATKQPVSILILLVAIKIVADIHAHVKERRNSAKTSTTIRQPPHLPHGGGFWMKKTSPGSLKAIQIIFISFLYFIIFLVISTNFYFIQTQIMPYWDKPIQTLFTRETRKGEQKLPKPSDSPWTKHVDEEAGYSYEYPSDWKKEEIVDSQNGTYATQNEFTQKSSVVRKRDSQVLFYLRYQENDPTCKDSKIFQPHLPYFKFSESSYDGYKANIYEGQLRGSNTYMKTIYIQKENRCYIVYIQDEVENPNKTVIDRIESSLVLFP